MTDPIDSKSELVNLVRDREFTLQGVNFLDDVIEFLGKGRIVHLRMHPNDGLAGQPAAFIVGIENLEIAALDLDYQSQLLGEPELVPMVLGPAIDKIADVDCIALQACAVAGAAQTNSAIDARSI